MKGITHMPIQITISGDTARQTLRELHGLSAGLGGAVPAPVEPAPMQDIAEEVPTGEEKTFPEPRRRSRPPKAKEPEQVEQPAEKAPNAETLEALREAEGGAPLAAANSVEELIEELNEPQTDHVAADEPQTDQAFTIDDARKALADLLAQPEGKAKAKQVFGQFNAAKLSDLAEADFKGFIAAIAKARGL
jgi:hypothetical protein